MNREIIVITFQAGEKQRLDNMADVTDKKQHFENANLNSLQRDLEKLDEKDLDPFLKYL